MGQVLDVGFEDCRGAELQVKLGKRLGATRSSWRCLNLLSLASLRFLTLTHPLESLLHVRRIIRRVFHHFYCSFDDFYLSNPHTSHLVSDTFTSPLGEHPSSSRSASMRCMRLHQSPVLSVARTKKVLHSSHFLALPRSPTKSVTPCAPTYPCTIPTSFHIKSTEVLFRHQSHEVES